MGGLVTCHHLSCIGEDGGGEKAEGIDTCVKKKGTKRDGREGERGVGATSQ